MHKGYEVYLQTEHKQIHHNNVTQNKKPICYIRISFATLQKKINPRHVDLQHRNQSDTCIDKLPFYFVAIGFNLSVNIVVQPQLETYTYELVATSSLRWT